MIASLVEQSTHSAAEATRKEADRAQEELSRELHKPAEEPVAAMKAKPRLPDPSRFQPGDLLWPRKVNQYVPYDSQPTGAFKTDKAEWEQEKQRFLSRVKHDPRASDYDRALAARLESLSFETFHERYVGDGGEGELTAQGWIPYVGHVAMVFYKDGKPWVVEAVPGKVRTISYEDWLTKRGHEHVWHGRVSGLTDEQRLHMIAEAIRHEAKPYEFWNFNLADETGFYCSKLMWYAAFRASGIALDDDSEPRRFFWYSPKQMFRSRHIQVLYSPGDYGTASVEAPNSAQTGTVAPTFEKTLEGKSCDVVFSECVMTCRTPDLEGCVQSCCCRFGTTACPEAPRCCPR
jgi:cell wall-associated NlpC family hydrolase